MRKTLTNSANITGFQNEDIFATLGRILSRKDYLVTTQKSLAAKESPIFSSGEILRVDFYFEGKPAAPNGLAVSAKYQEQDGSADSKVYYEVEYVIKRCMPVPTILLVRGPHWLGEPRKKARNWLTNQVDYKRLREVFYSVDDLYQWASNLPDCTGFNGGGSNGHSRPPTLPGMGQGELL
jgi:hypothetical protein